MAKEYEPLQEVRQTLKIPWYRCPIEPAKLKEHTRRSNVKGFLQTFGHLGLMAITAFLVYFFFEHRIWVPFAVSLWAFGSVNAFANHACHELSHGTVFRTKWLNAFFLRFFSLLGWFNFHHYRQSHTYHHLYTLHPRGDREVVLPKYPSLEFLYLLQLFTICIFGGFESNGLIPRVKSMVRVAFLGKLDDEWSEAIFAGDQGPARRKAVNWARFYLLFHAAVIAVSVVFGLWMIPVLVTFGTFIANWWRYFIGVPMHVGLRDNVPDFRLCVRTITLDPLSTFVYWRMSWHLEHHMFAAVPCYNLRKLYRTLASDMPKPRTLGEAWREMRDTWRKQQEDPGYQFSTPLPPPKGKTEPPDPLGGSLGDLKPKTLD
jgi:fatty acid desaturase